MPWSWTSPLKTGSTISLSTWGSSIRVSKLIFWPLGPLAWTLYCQKCLSFLPPEEPVEVFNLEVEGLVPSKSLSSTISKMKIIFWQFHLCNLFTVRGMSVSNLFFFVVITNNILQIIGIHFGHYFVDLIGQGWRFTHGTNTTIMLSLFSSSPDLRMTGTGCCCRGLTHVRLVYRCTCRLNNLYISKTENSCIFKRKHTSCWLNKGFEADNELRIPPKVLVGLIIEPSGDLTGEGLVRAWSFLIRSLCNVEALVGPAYKEWM